MRPEPEAEIVGAILVGGKSRRMRRDKAFLTIEGMTLLERVARAFGEIVAATLLVGGDEERFARFGMPVTPDVRPGSSLGGLYTALLHSPAPYILVAPCDIPFPSVPLFRHLVSLRHDYDAVVPLTGAGYEPLCAVYGKRCLEPMRRLLDAGNYRIYDFYPEVALRAVPENELRAVDPSGCGLVNVNTPEDFRAIAEEK
jgi:molybdenum cofactor guanylyltransferase